jgi:hypothetical protein
LKVGGIGETVTVTGDSAPLVETTKTDVSGVIDQRRLENLACEWPLFASSAILIPGATLQPSFDPTKARVGTFSVGGSTGRNLNITIDGGDNKDNAVGGILQNFSMEGIQEFALSTQRFSQPTAARAVHCCQWFRNSGNQRISRFRLRLLPRRQPECERTENPGRSQFGTLQESERRREAAIQPPTIRRVHSWPNQERQGLLLRHDRAHARARQLIVATSDQEKIGFLAPFGYEAVQFLPQPFNDWQYTVKGDFNLVAESISWWSGSPGRTTTRLNDQGRLFACPH